MISHGFRTLLSSLATIALVITAACGTSAPAPGPSMPQPPTAKTRPQASIGQGEAQLSLIAPEGYIDDSWVKPFEAQSGCKATPKYVGPSDEMLTLMKDVGGGTSTMAAATC